MSKNTDTKVPLGAIPHAAPQGNPIPPPSPTATQARDAAFLHVVVQHLFGNTMLHLLPVSRTASRGEVIAQVVRLHNKQTRSRLSDLEDIFAKNVIEVVPISNTAPPKTVAATPTAVLGPGVDSPELTVAMHQPELFGLAGHGTFITMHEDVLATADPPKALHVGRRIRVEALVSCTLVIMGLALVLGTCAAGLTVGLECLMAVAIVSAVLFVFSR